MNSPRLTRRAAAAALVTSASVLGSAPAPQGSVEKPLQAEVREQLSRNLDQLRKAELSIFTEPSFAFRTF